MKNKLISLSEFKSISQLSEDKILLLIEQGLVPLHIAKDSKVFVEIENFKLESCIDFELSTHKKDKLSEKEIELFSSKILAFLEEATLEAFELANKWNDSSS